MEEKKTQIFIIHGGMTFKNKNGRFKIFEFPEIIKMIKNDIKKSSHL